MDATLADGSTYSGQYFQITKETTVDTLEPLWVGWNGYGRFGRGMTGMPDRLSSGTTPGRVVANLGAADGEHALQVPTRASARGHGRRWPWRVPDARWQDHRCHVSDRLMTASGGTSHEHHYTPGSPMAAVTRAAQPRRVCSRANPNSGQAAGAAAATTPMFISIRRKVRRRRPSNRIVTSSSATPGPCRKPASIPICRTCRRINACASSLAATAGAGVATGAVTGALVGAAVSNRGTPAPAR